MAFYLTDKEINAQVHKKPCLRCGEKKQSYIAARSVIGCDNCGDTWHINLAITKWDILPDAKRIDILRALGYSDGSGEVSEGSPFESMAGGVGEKIQAYMESEGC